MIHSLAGGSLKDLEYASFAKVEILSGIFAGDKYWYIACGQEIEGSVVLVPIGKNNTLVEAKVLRIDKNISAQVAPIPIKRAKRVYRVVK